MTAVRVALDVMILLGVALSSVDRMPLGWPFVIVVAFFGNMSVDDPRFDLWSNPFELPMCAVVRNYDKSRMPICSESFELLICADAPYVDDKRPLREKANCFLPRVSPPVV